MKRLHQVQGWLSRVEAEETEVDKLIKDSAQEIEKLCLGGYCSWNIKSSYKYGKKIAQKLQVVSKLKEEGCFPTVAEIWSREDPMDEPITGERILPQIVVDERPCEPTVGLETTFDAVWRYLGEKQVGVIGLYGMGGVGKTTLLTQINNKFVDVSNDFDIVMWVVVSKDLQLEKIQENIGRKIGLSDESWRSKSLEEKAMDIFKILRRKRFVLLLDDIWERVDLVKVGVPPLSSPPLSSSFTSKVVFTTRFVEVCGHMEAHRKLKVECLADEEAWKLFRSKVGGDALDNHPEIPELAQTAAKECGGLPLALITIGRAMACKKTPAEWRYAIEVLRRSAHEFPGLGKEVYPLLKFSYDSLPSCTLRACLLYCSLFPEDYNIPKKHLIDCWIGEGFLGDDDVGGTQYQGQHHVGVLLHACLLEEEDDDFVKMHDVIRDMTLWLACEFDKEKENFLVRAGTGMTEPGVGRWEGVRRISLMENQINSLSGSPTCPHLLTLFLNRNDLSSITDGFFAYMSSLRVLNLSNNDSLRELPAEISKLVSLHQSSKLNKGVAERVQVFGEHQMFELGEYILSPYNSSASGI
uniref:NBS-LRR disease resistance protein NBS39 n=1 Tax=Dimocarpus longan TaxID=128017 RepID=I6SWP7_9ROSI|nr:NBS-LRR disease resistance protein NBS39 [Dimocarpus longan]